MENTGKMDMLVDKFGDVKTKSDALKKEADGYKDEIKAFLCASDTDEYATDKYRVKYTVAVSRDFNQEKLLAKLKEVGLTECIKTVEVVDMNNLENAIYNKKIDASILADCEIVKETPKLNIYKVKK